MTRRPFAPLFAAICATVAWLCFPAPSPAANPALSCDVSLPAVGLAVPLPRVAAALASGGPLRIVAIGSSSTAGAGASAPERGYPARLETYLSQHFPGTAVTVDNRGVNGEGAAEMVARFQTDVLEEKPDLVIWQVGANSVLQGDSPAEAETVIRDGVARLRAAGPDVVLMDLQYAPAMLAKPHHADMELLLARVAEADHVGLFHRFAVMRRWVLTHQAEMADLVGPDGIHQNDFGYDCVARSLAVAIEEAAGLGPTGAMAAEPSGARPHK